MKMLLLVALLSTARAQVEVRDPPYFNVALNKPISATATCGQLANGSAVREEVCQLTLTGTVDTTEVCDFCDASRRGDRHPIEYAVDGRLRYWQSPPLSRGQNFHEVNITIDLGQEFHVAYVIVLAGNSPRPGHWILERSLDGVNYLPWQYFVQEESDCDSLYGITLPQRNIEDDTVLCTTQYSGVVPLADGQMFISLIDGRPGAENFSLSLHEWTRAAYIRLRLLRVTTLFGEFQDPGADEDPSLTRRYYYSIREIEVGGRCRCNGHGDKCEAPEGKHQLECVCTHNTCGPNCNQCCKDFSQYKWRPSVRGDEFSCERCNCHGHSTLCEYDETVDQRGLSLNLAGDYRGGGVCQNCSGHTAGYNCELCAPGYYRTPDIPSTAECIKCNCSGAGVLDGTCDGNNNGQCTCKKNVEGFYCNLCKSGFFGLDASNPDGCTPCACDQSGSMVGLAECTDDAVCACKALTSSQNCADCMLGTYGLSGNDIFGCRFCTCDVGGSIRPVDCDKEQGSCDCRQGMTGKHCDAPATGTCLPSLHTTLRYEAEEGKWNNFKTAFAFSEDEFPGFTFFGYVILGGDSQDSIQVTTDVPRNGKYQVVLKYLLVNGSSDATAKVLVNDTVGRQTSEIDLKSGNGTSYSASGEFSLAAGMWEVTVVYTGSSRLLVDHVILLPEVYYRPTILETPVPDICTVGVQHEKCQLYTYPSLDLYASQSAITGTSSPTPFAGKLMAPITSRFRNIILVFNGLDTIGFYALIISYYSQLNHSQQLEVIVESEVSDGGVLNLLPCTYTFGCREVATLAGEVVEFAVRGSGEAVVTLSLPVGDEISNSLFIEHVHLVPVTSWTATLIIPAFYCYYDTDGCIPTEYSSLSVVGGSFVYAGDEGYFFNAAGERENIPVSSDAELNRLSGSSRGAALLNASHTEMHMDLAVSASDDFYTVIQYHNPGAFTHVITVELDGVQFELPLSYCPDKSGCRVTSEVMARIDISSVTISVMLHGNDMLYILSAAIIPRSEYEGREYTRPFAVNLNDKFISECAANEFNIVDSISSAFCAGSALSLSAFFHNGSLDCSCDAQGSVSSLCDSSTCGCQCKPNIVGERCTRCRIGYYGFPDCKPCECIGGGICDDVSGQCRCPPNVRGQNCDRCEQKFYDLRPIRGCIACDCHPVRSSNLKCNRRTGQCKCKEKFSGRQCDECISGKYMPPRCKDCECDPRGSIGSSCDQMSGQCSCKGNMNGRTCSECRIGTFNYSLSNPDGCQLCNCDRLGSVGEGCHNVTGQCQCKSGVIGLKCNQCAPNTYRLPNGPCTDCDCHPNGSSSSACDVRNGKCPCRRFVRGRQCARCLRGYYELSLDGCRACECSQFGSSGTDCDVITGQCVCKSGTFGRRCDQCASRHVVGPDGCRPCGNCTDSLMDLLEMLIGQLNDTNKNLTNFTVLVNAWNRLRAMREQYNQTRDALLIILGNLRNVDIAINGLFARISTVTSDAEKVDLHINSSVTWALTVNKNTTESKTDADDLLQRATTLLGRLNGVINSLRLLRERLDANVSNIADITAEAQRILNEILDRDFNTVQLAALDAGVQANVTLEIAEEFQIEGAVFINRTTTLQQRLTDYILLLSEANNLADMAISNVTTTNSLLDDVSSNLTDVQIWLTKLEIEASDINSNLSGTQQLISHAEQAIENATDAYNAAKNISRILDIEIAAISRAVYGYRQNVAEVGPSVLTAVKHSRTIHRHSNTLKRLFNKVKSEAEGPMAKYHAYHCDNITAIVENATRYTVVAIDNDFSDLLRRAKESLQKSEMLHDEGNTLNGTVARTNVAIDETNRLVRESRAKEAVPRNKLHGIIDVQGKLDNDTKSLGRGITDIETKAGRYVKRAKGAQGKVEVLTKDVSAAENDLNNLIKELEEPNRILRETEAQVVEISEHVNEMLELHRQTDQEFERLDGILAGFDDELDKINREIEKAKKAAMLVDVPVSAGQEAAALYAPESVNIPLAYTNVSMVVKAANRRGLLFYMGERKKRAADVNFLAVELTRYKPKVTFGMDGKETPVNVDVSLQDGGWYEIKVLRVATTATVYVKSLEEEESHNVTVNRLGHALFTVGSDGNVFVGGLPSDSSDQVPSNVEQKQFQGCIDHIAVNSQRLPIFAFKEPDPKKTTKVASCSGARPVPLPVVSSDHFYLTGRGYVAIQNSKLQEFEWWFGHDTNMELIMNKLQTFQLNALIFYASGSDNKFLSLEVRNGVLVASFNNGGETVTAILHDVGIKKESSRIRLSHNSQTLKLSMGSSSAENSSAVTSNLSITSPFYFGGVPDDVKLPVGLTRHRFQGCFDAMQVKARGSDGASKTHHVGIVRTENYEDGSFGYLTDNCPVTTFQCATFQGSGFVKTQELKSSTTLDVYLSVYPTNESGVILFTGDKDSNYYYIVLNKGHVEFRWKNGDSDFSVTFDQAVTLRQWSSVSVTRNDKNKLTIIVGSQTESIKGARGNIGGSVYLGGVPSDAKAMVGDEVSQPFSGGLRGIVIYGNIINFDNQEHVFDEIGLTVELGSCTDVNVEVQPPQSSVLTPSHVAVTTPTTVSIDTVPPPCAPSPVTDTSSYYFDGQRGSHLEFQSDNPQIMKRKFKIEMQIRTFAETGLFLFAGSRNLHNFIHLYLKDGKIKGGFALEDSNSDTAPAEAESESPVNDGKWHWVNMTRNGKKGSLIVDGNMVKFATDSESPLLRIITPFYVGNVVDVKLNKVKGFNQNTPGFKGCIRNIRFENDAGNTISSWDNERKLGSSVHNCYEKVAKGAGFNGQTSAVFNSQSWDINLPFVVSLTIRTSSPSGLLLSATDNNGEKYVALYIKQGKVVLAASRGDSSSSAQLKHDVAVCDNKWYQINATVDNTKLLLSVNGRSPIDTSFSSSRGTSTLVTSATLYIGGLPDGMVAAGADSTVGGFLGCIENSFYVDRGRTLAEAENIEQLNLTECPVSVEE